MGLDREEQEVWQVDPPEIPIPSDRARLRSGNQGKHTPSRNGYSLHLSQKTSCSGRPTDDEEKKEKKKEKKSNRSKEAGRIRGDGARIPVLSMSGPATAASRDPSGAKSRTMTNHDADNGRSQAFHEAGSEIHTSILVRTRVRQPMAKWTELSALDSRVALGGSAHGEGTEWPFVFMTRTGNEGHPWRRGETDCQIGN